MTRDELIAASRDKIISTRQSFDWNYLLRYIDAIMDLPDVMSDSEFCKLFQKMYDYVSDKIAPYDDGDIIGIYAVVDQIPVGTHNSVPYKK